jgi:hypothetical protein
LSNLFQGSISSTEFSLWEKTGFHLFLFAEVTDKKIGPSPYHYYSGMGPGLLSGIYRAQDARFHVKRMAEDRGATFVEDKVIKISPGQRTLNLESGKQVSYDNEDENQVASPQKPK